MTNVITFGCHSQFWLVPVLTTTTIHTIADQKKSLPNSAVYKSKTRVARTKGKSEKSIWPPNHKTLTERQASAAHHQRWMTVLVVRR